MILTIAPVSNLVFTTLGLLPVALPILLVGNIFTLVNAWWLLPLWTVWPFEYPIALYVVLYSDCTCMESILGMSFLAVVSMISLSSATRWMLMVFLFPMNVVDWLFDPVIILLCFCVFPSMYFCIVTNLLTYFILNFLTRHLWDFWLNQQYVHSWLFLCMFLLHPLNFHLHLHLVIWMLEHFTKTYYCSHLFLHTYLVCDDYLGNDNLKLKCLERSYGILKKPLALYCTVYNMAFTK